MYAKKRKFKRPYKKMVKKPKQKKIRTLIRREVAKLSENKIIEGSISDTSYYNYINSSTCYSLIPNVSQGTTQATRIGNRIRVRKATMRMAINISNQTVSVAPTYVDVYIFKYKPTVVYPNNSLPTGAMDNFLQQGATSTFYSGIVTDYLRPVNKDLFISKYRRRFLMYNPLNSTSVNASTSSINPNRYLTVDLTKMLKKQLQYNDTNSYCTNDDLWIAVASTQTDGTILNPVTVVGKFSIIVTVEFEDN